MEDGKKKVIEFGFAEPAEELGPSRGWLIHRIWSWQMPPPKDVCWFRSSAEVVVSGMHPNKDTATQRSVAQTLTHELFIPLNCGVLRSQVAAQLFFFPKSINSYFQDLGFSTIPSVHSRCWCSLFLTVFFSKTLCSLVISHNLFEQECLSSNCAKKSG